MKKYILGFSTAIIVFGLIYAVLNFMPALKNTTTKAVAVKCSTQKNLCEEFIPSADGGSLRVTILTHAGTAAKDLEVDLGTQPGAVEYYMKHTDNNGVAEFVGIPTGAYMVYFNGNTFPKEYGSSSIIERVELNKSQTIEKTIMLLSGS